MKDNNKQVDELSGVETTGHEWDGIQELNYPSPRWWLIVFLITCIWAIAYWVVYPAWPTISGKGERGGTKGLNEWSQTEQLKVQLNVTQKKRDTYLKRFRQSSFQQIIKNENLYKFALAGGEIAFKENCAACHGSGGAGYDAYPNLNDDDWLWGGKLEEIQQTISYGIRANHPKTRNSVMPSFKNVFNKEDLREVAKYVVSLSNENILYSEKGESLYIQNCSSCHNADGSGNKLFGAPNLKDSIWLYGDSLKRIKAQISNPTMGIMPFWKGRLDDDTIRQLTLYVYSLGGGV